MKYNNMVNVFNLFTFKLNFKYKLMHHEKFIFIISFRHILNNYEQFINVINLCNFKYLVLVIMIIKKLLKKHYQKVYMNSGPQGLMKG